MYRIETRDLIFASLSGTHPTFIVFGTGYTTDPAALDAARQLGYRVSEVSGAAVPGKYAVHTARLSAWPHHIGVIEFDENEPTRAPLFPSFHGREFDIRDVLDGRVTARDIIPTT